MSDIIILGTGPAGISAAAYTTRAGLKTTVIGRDGGALLKAHQIENYYGFSQPVSGEELIRTGMEQARRLGAEIVNDEVVGIAYDGEFVASGISGTYRAPAMILATGASRGAPKLEGLRRLEGRGVSYCAVCDAFFYRGKHVAVLGNGEYALHEAMELLPVAGSVTLLTNGKEPSVEIPEEIKVVTQKLDRLEGDPVLTGVVLEDGGTVPVSGLFVAMGVAGSTDLARKLGAQTKGSAIVVDSSMQTNIPGLFAAGDCTGGMLQVAKAVYEGAQAAAGAIKLVRERKNA
ncbi:MAG: NAD(P)/FAD-dependent oxidoreductase [Clostridiales bacterium]|jgi:thioredoxin reductase (NADPH)|nr:NAD(P)/FAD-dependent oxidoreductase [Clostridiales bacterium]